MLKIHFFTVIHKYYSGYMHAVFRCKKDSGSTWEFRTHLKSVFFKADIFAVYIRKEYYRSFPFIIFQPVMMLRNLMSMQALSAKLAGASHSPYLSIFLTTTMSYPIENMCKIKIFFSVKISMNKKRN